MRTTCVLVLGILVAGCRSTPTQQPATNGSNASAPSAKRAQRQLESLSIDLQAMQTEPPPYEGNGRNIFDFGRAPVAHGTEAPPPPPVETDLPPVTTSIAVPAAPRINLKYAGCVIKPQGVKKIKYAILLDGQYIYTGAEGEVVGNRYRIVEIGVESVTVGLTGSSATQRLPLKTN